MSELIRVQVPDLGDFKDVDVIEILVKPGDPVKAEESLISLETDKATMDVPAPADGVISEILVAVGAKVNPGDIIAHMTTAHSAAASTAIPASSPKPAPEERAPEQTAPKVSSAGKYDCQVLVLGSGPGGYTAAFRAADLGLKTVLVERYSDIGGVCLNVGCIPSKALLHAAKVIEEAESFAEHGLVFGKPEIQLDRLRGWKESVVKRLTGGLEQLAKRRDVTIVQGYGRFTTPNALEVEAPDGTRSSITFEKAIIAAGSQAVHIPGFPFEDERVMDSTGALALADIPKRMLVIGGGIIGLEMACVYDALGTEITVVELLPGLIPGCDRDLVRPLEKRIRNRYGNIYLETRVTACKAEKEGIRVSFEGKGAPAEDLFDRVLVAVGRRPNGKLIGAELAGVFVDERGFIPVDNQQKTNVNHIFAIGDIVGQPMLAHKATHEGKVAAEVAAGMKSAFIANVIPSVAYTDPEIAWVGVTEEQAREKGIKYGKGVFPWAASGRSLALGRDEGMTKLLFDEETERLIGAGAVGPNAGEILAEACLAIEMGADAADIGQTIHAHPTLSESIGMAAEAFEGTITDLYLPKKK